MVLRTTGALRGGSKAVAGPDLAFEPRQLPRGFSLYRVRGGGNLDFDLKPTGMFCELTSRAESIRILRQV